MASSKIRLKSLQAKYDGLLVEWAGDTQQKGESLILCTVKALEPRPDYGVAEGQTLEVLWSNVAAGEELPQ